MDHPRFVSGDITTAFIAEEYPEGFQGVTLPEPVLRRIAAAAAAMHRVAESGARASPAAWATTSGGWGPTGWSRCRVRPSR